MVSRQWSQQPYVWRQKQVHRIKKLEVMTHVQIIQRLSSKEKGMILIRSKNRSH
jgi:hypothetical protein